MSNHPVFGIAECPYCYHDNPVYWNGNFKWRCVHCHKSFKVHRQKLKKVELVEKND